MTLFDERERAFENLFVHEEGLRFRALARRNQLFGRWAAEQLGLRGSECQAYVRSFVDGAVRSESDEALIERVRWDLAAVMTQCRMSVFAGRWCGRQLRRPGRCGPKHVLRRRKESGSRCPAFGDDPNAAKARWLGIEGSVQKLRSFCTAVRAMASEGA